MTNREKLIRITELTHMMHAGVRLLAEAQDGGSYISSDTMSWACTSMLEKLTEIITLAESIPFKCISDPEDDAGKTE